MECSAHRRLSLHLSLHLFTRSAAAALMLFASALTPPLAAAAPNVKLVVDSPDGQPNAGEPRLWTGTIFRDGQRIPDIPECRTVSCEHIQVRVKLPSKIWQTRPGGVHVAIRFINGTPDDNLALVVYRDGVRIGASTAQVATAQSTLAQGGATKHPWRRPRASPRSSASTSLRHGGD